MQTFLDMSPCQIICNIVDDNRLCFVVTITGYSASSTRRSLVRLIDTWVTDPDRRGLAILTIGFLDKLPDQHIERIATKALAGPHAADARKHLSESGNPRLMKLVE